MTPPLKPTLEDLLAQSAWVRRLAHGLIADPQAAEDLAQDAWVAAIQRPPVHASNLRGWFSKLMRNLARERHRGESRRAAREERSARPEGDDPSARFAVHRDLVDAVDSLAEPWRHTIVLRFFEGLSLKEIAERDDTSVATVNSRLRRAMALLRERLDDGSGRKAWLGALVSLAQDLGPAKSAMLGATFMQTTHKIALGAVIVLGITTAVLVLPQDEVAATLPEEEPGSSKVELTAPEREIELASSEVETPVRAPLTKEEVPSTVPVAEPAALQVSSFEGVLVGRVVDEHGSPQSGFEVVLADYELRKKSLGRSDENGEFTIDASENDGMLRIKDEEYRAMLEWSFKTGSRHEPLLVIAPKTPVAGLVRDVAGDPIEGALVIAMLPGNFRSRFGVVTDAGVAREPVARTGADGRFELEDSLYISGTKITIRHPQYVYAEFDFPEYPDSSLEFVLELSARPETEVRGMVVDYAGRGVPDAMVALGYRTTRTSEDGGFAIEMGMEGQYDRLIAVRPGFLPAIQWRVEEGGEDTPWPDFVVLRLEGEPLAIEGRVVDESDQPVAEVRVWPLDATFFGAIGEGGQFAEGMLRNTYSPDEDWVKAMGDASWPAVYTDEQGRFRIEGLLDREYVLRTFDRDRLLQVDSAPIMAGDSNARLVLDRGAHMGPVAGVLKSGDGTPLAGVTVQPYVTPHYVPYGVSGMISHPFTGEQKTTDEKGRFRFENIARNAITLTFEHSDILPLRFSLDASQDYLNLEVTASLKYHLQVMSSSSEVDRLAVHDESDEPLQITILHGTGRITSTVAMLEDGRTEVLSISDAARTLVVMDDKGNELSRQELSLEFGTRNEVRLP